jgi:hypothetical protein
MRLPEKSQDASTGHTHCSHTPGSLWGNSPVQKLFHGETYDEKVNKLRADKRFFFLSFYADSYCLTPHFCISGSKHLQAKFLLSMDYANCNIGCLDDVICLHKDFKNLYAV